MSKNADGVGRSTQTKTSILVESIRRLLWFSATIGAIASVVIAVKNVGQPDPLTGLVISFALGPYVAARAWDELFPGE